MDKRLVFIFAFVSIALLFASCAEETDTAAKPAEIGRVSFIAVGDNLLHDAVLSDARAAGSYDFTPIYEPVRELVERADFAFINEEGPLCGERFGYSGYPLFNSPSEIGRDLIRTGFDIVNQANNHALDQGAEGVLNTIEFWNTSGKKAVMLGMYSNQADREKIRTVEKNGIKIALLSYTEGTGSNRIAREMSCLVAISERSAVKADVDRAKACADAVIVFMHWGDEYSHEPNSRQRSFAQYLAALGVDLVVGCHPHVAQPLEWIDAENGKKLLTVYSLGNFLSCQHKRETLLGGMLSLAFVKRADGSVTIEEPKVIPLVTHYDKHSRNFRVYPLYMYTESLAAAHGISKYSQPLTLDYLETAAEKAFGEFYPLDK